MGEVRPPVPPGVKRISDLKFAQVNEPVPMSLLLDLYLPADDAGTKPVGKNRPVVLWIHGGGCSPCWCCGGHGQRSDHTRGNKPGCVC